MKDSRTANSIRNTSMSALAQVVSIILNFIGRTFFIKLLSIEYLGINALFANIITILSLAELGIGTAIVYMMYDPIAKGNIQKVAAFNHLFRKIYNIIGCFVFLAGLCLVPFLGKIIKEAPNITENLTIIYVLFLANTSVSYFFTYKRSLLIAHQKEYLNSRNVICFAIIKDVVLILVLLATRNFYLYLASQIIITLLSNLSISKVANKAFPEVVNCEGCEITKTEKKTIFKNTTGMLCHKIGAVIVSGTDNILISSFVGIVSVGLYANYQLIQKVASQIISQAVNAVTASVGNLAASSDTDKVYDVFKKLYFINFTLSFFVAVMYYSLIDTFITIWIGKDFILNNFAVLILSVNLFFNQIRVPSQVIINSYGVFWEIKWKSIVEAIINISSSLVFVIYFEMGLTGVLLGTVVSNLATNLWWEPYGAFCCAMKKPLFEYAKVFCYDTLVFASTIFCISVTNQYLLDVVKNSIVCFLIQLFLSMTISIIIYFVLYYRKSEFKYLQSNVIKLIRK